MKKLFAFAVLLTSLTGLAESVADSENKYYAGLNFGAGWSNGFKMKPGVVFGYHYNKKSKFELEVLSKIRSLQNIGASVLANYRYYPNSNTNPVKFYVSIGMGGYLQIVPFGFSSSEDLIKEAPQKAMTRNLYIFDLFERIGDHARDLFGDLIGTKKREKKEKVKPPVKGKVKPPTVETIIPTTEEKLKPPTEEKIKPIVTKEVKPSVTEEITNTIINETKPPVTKEITTTVTDKKKPLVKNNITPPLTKGITTTVADEKKMLPPIDKILSSISYKLKVGVDYEITPRIVGAVGITMGGQLSGLKALKMPGATLEVGIRYNF